MLFFKAVLLGFAVAIPLGPIGALCIARTLHMGFAAGFAGGVGTALADATYAAFAAFGFAAMAGVLDGGAGWVRILGGLLLIGLGIRGWLSGGGQATPATANARTLITTAAATYALTIANPATILSFVAMFAGLGLAEDATIATASIAVAGVFLGSLAWWAILSGGVALTRSRLPAGFARLVSRLSAVMLIGLGGWALIPAL
ncbi:LysE family transporter [Pararhodobacter zhoushanensis]|uniref:LysE family transporter n=1 Tax=Pararhodobacter zhoushanensis TaxID=2479545 RepID=A0ABT3GYS7_9RHOB|nr:LysE family transporter [Pararhodobacter zhoushanensis]MCW1932689.1 LysE family transporter [Pararhodobacter zhoushanensis]